MNSVREFYNRDSHVEWERLDRHRTEFAVTMRALNDYLPPPPAQLIDIGGGPGRYAVALAEQGYNVTLVDLAQESLERAAIHAQEANVQLVDIQVANALDLSAFPTATYNAVLFLGPLYHLLLSEERNQAVQEARRLLKPGGIIFAGFLMRYSALRICAERFPQWLFENQAYVDKIMNTGAHSGEWGFTAAYYAHTDEVRPFMEANGFITMALIGCEGIVGHAEESMHTLTGPAWEWWADLNYRLGNRPDLHGAATHLLYVGRKAG